MRAEDCIETRARRINCTWITQGNLAESTEQYLDHLGMVRPQELPRVCRLAVDAARTASMAGEDPKPAFYACLFCTATKEERDTFLKYHFFTRLLSTEYQLSDGSRPG